MAEQFDPDAYLASKANSQQATPPPNVEPIDQIQIGQFDPDAYLAAKGNESYNRIQTKYGTLPQQALTAVEGGAKGLLSAQVVAGAEKGLTKLGVPGLSPEEQALREEANPKIAGASEIAGFAAPAVATLGTSALARAGVELPSAVSAGVKALGKYSQAGLLEKAGLAIAPEAVTTVGKIGSKAVQMAVENAGYQAGNETAKLINNAPQTVGSAMANIGLAGAIGGVLGGAGSSVAPIWKATAGKATSGLLGTIAKRMGGIEGVVSEPINEAITNSGIEVAPELKAQMAKDPAVVEMARTLSQRDTSSSGLAFQKATHDFHQQAGDAVSEALGKSVDQIPEEFSKHEAGKKIGEALSSEFSEKVNPLVDRYDAYGKMFEGKELDKGVIGDVSEKIAQKALDEGWTVSPSSDIMKEVNRIQKEVVGLKTLKDLGRYIKQVGENTASTLPFGQQTPISRAGGIIKGILRNAEADTIGAHLGEKEGPAAVSGYEGLRSDYARAANLKDALEDRLGTKGSTAGYAKGLKEMARTDGEKIFQRLSGKNDADLIRFVTENFPKTAEAMKSEQLNELLHKSVQREEGKTALNASKAIGALEKLSPEQRGFLIPEQGAARLKGVQTLLETLKNPKHNFSNTARVADKLLEHIPGVALGLATMLLGHGVPAALLVGKIGEYLAKDAPDAIRLSLLKWLGSGKEVNAPAFKAMVDYFHHTIQGEKLSTNAIKAIFNGSSKVIPEHKMPDQRDLDDLDKKVQEIQMDPGKVMDSGSMTAYYLPDHGSAVSQTIGNAAQYLSSIKPDLQKKAPLDPEPVLSDAQKTAYNRALEIAQQPLVVMKSIQEGKLTSQDVKHLKALYPAVYDRLTHKITDEMMNHVSKKRPISNQVKQGLSLFLGQPLDSGMSQQSIFSNQQVFGNPQNQSQGPQAKKPSIVGMREMKISNRFSLHPSEDQV